MNLKKVGGMLAASAMAAMAFVLPAGPAQAAGAPFDLYASTEVDGMPSNVWPSVHCAYTYELTYKPADGCFKETDDLFFAQDLMKDGRSAMLYFEVDTGRNGACVNSHGNGSTGRCNLEIGEGHRLCIYMGTIDMGSTNFPYSIYWSTRECFENNE